MDKELERLLKDVLDELKDLTVILKGSTKAIKQNANSIKANQNFLKEHTKKLKEEIETRKKAGEAVDDLEKELKQSTTALDFFEKQTKKSGKGLLSMGKKLFDIVASPFVAAGKTVLGFSDVSRPINSLGDAIALGVADIKLLGPAAMEVAKDFDTSRELFVQLAQTGAGFNGNLLALSKASADAGIPLPKFADLIASNSELLGKFFGTVQSGVTQFTSLGKGLRSMTERDLAGFGLTLDDTAEFLTTFVEAERSRGNVQSFTNQQLIDGTKAYTKQLVTLSALTGKSVKELDEQNKAAMADSLMRMKVAGMDKKRADGISLAFSQMSPNLQQFTKELLAFGGPTSKIGFELEALTNGDMRRALQTFINNAADPDAFRVFQNTLGEIGQRVSKEGQSFVDLGILTGDFAEAIDITVGGIRKSVDRPDLDKTLARLSKSGSQAVNVLSRFDTLAATLTDARVRAVQTILPPVLDALTSKLAAAADDGGVIDEFVKVVEAGTKALMRAFGMDPDDDSGGIFNFFGFKPPKNYEPIQDYLGDDELDNHYNESTKNTFQRGSGGLRDFGTGTFATLHGREAVVTEKQLGNLVKEILAFGMPITPRSQSIPNVDPVAIESNFMDVKKILQQQRSAMGTNIQSDGMSSSFTALNNAVGDLIKTNKSMEQHLNTLVSIGAMTERNTKNVGNNLANLSSSVI